MDSKSSIKSLRINISVIGDSKGFRFEVMHKALDIGIKGFVQRTGEDEFHIAAEGDEENLEKLLSWLENGFLWTDIKEGNLVEGEIENFSSFDMRDAIFVNKEIPPPEKEKQRTPFIEKIRNLLKRK
jgi:acylphosphatase